MDHRALQQRTYSAHTRNTVRARRESKPGCAVVGFRRSRLGPVYTERAKRPAQPPLPAQSARRPQSAAAARATRDRNSPALTRVDRNLTSLHRTHRTALTAVRRPDIHRESIDGSVCDVRLAACSKTLVHDQSDSPNAAFFCSCVLPPPMFVAWPGRG
jgi:hypothetical protein